MSLMIHSNLEKLQEDTNKKLEQTQFHNTKQGSVVSLITNVFNNQIYNMSKDFDKKLEQTKLSKATGKDLEDLGAIFNCSRNGETDEEYRYKISKQVTFFEKANETSIMLAGKIPEVDKIELKKNAFGPDSFVLFPIGKDKIISDETLNKIYNEVNKVISYGTFFQVINPVFLNTKLKVKIIENNTYRDKNTSAVLKDLIQKEIKVYLNSREIGEDFSFDKLKKYLFYEPMINKFVTDIILLSCSINDINYKDITTGWNQRIIEHEESDAIILE